MLHRTLPAVCANTNEFPVYCAYATMVTYLGTLHGVRKEIVHKLTGDCVIFYSKRGTIANTFKQTIDLLKYLPLI